MFTLNFRPMKDWLRAAPDLNTGTPDLGELRRHYDGQFRRLLSADMTTFDWMEGYFNLFSRPEHFAALYRLVANFRRYPHFRNWFSTRYTNNALANMALLFDKRIREPETWNAEVSANAPDTLLNLAIHLFEHYPVPAFLRRFWYQQTDVTRAWFFHVNAGGSYFGLEGAPLPVTRAMAHHLAQAPEDQAAPGVFRWAQLKALNMPEDLIVWFGNTVFMHRFENEDFWETVFRLIAKEYDTQAPAEEDLGLLFVYLGYMKFGHVPGDNPAQNLKAPEPGLTMKGRKLKVLMRDAKRWYGQNAMLFRQWDPSGISQLVEVVEEGGVSILYATVEMLNSYELSTEGQMMSHCVGDYADECRDGASSIWSLRRFEDERYTRMVTIEVNHATRNLVQICGACNEPPTEQDMKLITKWTVQAQLNLGDFAPEEVVEAAGEVPAAEVAAVAEPAAPVVAPVAAVQQPVVEGAPAQVTVVPVAEPLESVLSYEVPARVAWIAAALIFKGTFLLLQALGK